MELIHRQMTELLRKRGVKPIHAVGADFDPRFHQAVVAENSPTRSSATRLRSLRESSSIACGAGISTDRW